jgi:hypothetical protein
MAFQTSLWQEQQSGFLFYAEGLILAPGFAANKQLCR